MDEHKKRGTPLDSNQLADLINMWHSEPVFHLAHTFFMSVTLCGPFEFSIPRMKLKNKKDLNPIIESYWIPWQKMAWKIVSMIGVCPYYFANINEHSVPMIPELDMGTIYIQTTKQHTREYKWRYNDQQHDTNMYWITGLYPPSAMGKLRTAIAALLPQYKTILVLQDALQKAAVQNSEPTHILEHHPPAATATNDDLTHLVATFGEKSAGLSKARMEEARANEIRVNMANMLKQMNEVHRSNLRNGAMSNKKLMWTDLEEDVVERMDAGMTNRTFPLSPFYKYVQSSRANVVADLNAHRHTFILAAAAAMDFAIEFIQPTGSARTQNIKGSERYENERIKDAVRFFTTITKQALIIAYGAQFNQAFDEARGWQIPKKNLNTNRIVELYPELDVQVELACTPFVSYDDLKQMWLDGILNKEDFAHHVFHTRGLPATQITLSDPVILDNQQPQKKHKTSSIDE